MPAEMMVERRLTVQGALDAATTTLARAGLVAPRLEASRLLADLLGLSPAELTLGRGQVIEPDRRRWLDRAVARRAAGEPLAYVTGLAGFRHLVLRSDPRALIPRPETEGLVDRALAIGGRGVVADIGTGTGCLALSLRQEGAYSLVLAVDSSADALRLADQNRRRCQLDVKLVRGDLTDALAADSIDVLVSNPPYLSRVEYLALDPCVRDYEPQLALESGSAGLDATVRLLAEARRVTRRNGTLLLEIAADRSAESARVAAAAGWSQVRIDEDLFGRPRYLIAQREG